jgi:hypothetical protein
MCVRIYVYISSLGYWLAWFHLWNFHDIVEIIKVALFFTFVRVYVFAFFFGSCLLYSWSFKLLSKHLNEEFNFVYVIIYV